jgi:hypothetical protein
MVQSAKSATIVPTGIPSRYMILYDPVLVTSLFLCYRRFDPVILCVRLSLSYHPFLFRGRSGMADTSRYCKVPRSTAFKDMTKSVGTGSVVRRFPFLFPTGQH